MSPTKREREYAKRRYEDWQQRQSESLRRRQSSRRRALAVFGAVAAVLVVIALAVIYLPGRGSSPATAQPSASGSASATANPCPVPGTATAKGGSWSSPPAASSAEARSWTLTLQSSCGPITAELDGKAAPQAVASTIFLARNGFWDNSPCHRLTTAGIYVLQCGDPTGSGSGGPGYTYGPIENAPKDDVYPAGTVAMARPGGNAKGMGSQFFIVYRDSQIPSDAAGGYTVIGKVVGGMASVEKIVAGGVQGGADQTDGAPVRPLSITSSAIS